MNIIGAIKGMFRRDQQSSPLITLRNKAGGMAYIKLPTADAVSDVNGQIVQTVYVRPDGYWTLNPTLVVKHQQRVVGANGVIVGPGLVNVFAAPDNSLIPLENPGDDAADESKAWLPPVPSQHEVTA